MELTTNHNLISYIKECGVFQWEIADVLHESDSSFNRRLHRNLTESEITQIELAVDCVLEKKGRD